MFKSLIHFELIFIHDLSNPIIFFCMYLSSFPNTIYIWGHLFDTVYSCLLCHRLIDHVSVGSFLIFLLFSHDICACFVPVPYYFDYYSFVVEFDIRKCVSSIFVLLSQRCFGYLGSFVLGWPKGLFVFFRKML